MARAEPPARQRMPDREGNHMKIAKVIGNIWATRKEERLAGL